MNFETFFRFISYLAVFCGFLALWVSGTFGVVESLGFVGVIVGAWFLEGSRWQISEWVGTGMIVLALPVFYLAWRFQIITPTGGETWIAGLLARMILSLTAVKLLQKKSDRDWIFLYLMSFFEVLLAAGLSISALYFASFIAYLLVMVCAVIAFEIRKTSFAVERSVVGDLEKKRDPSSDGNATLPVRRLPTAAVGLIVFIVALALPLFFMLPRGGGSGLGANNGGAGTTTGFGDTVRLGGSGLIQENNSIAMRVKFENELELQSEVYFRGAVLDSFDNRSWSRSKNTPPNLIIKGERDFVAVEPLSERRNFTKQTFIVEPMDIPMIFGVPRIMVLQAGFPLLQRDAYGSIRHKNGFERVTYTVYSDRSTPAESALRADKVAYTTDVQNYRDLPDVYDRRIADLAKQITEKIGNRYDKAKAVEEHLRNNFGYTLQQKAGGDEPLADFLFNVREGHCEYFATAMAVMLRTQGIATRVVNGFHGGEYNDTAGVLVVRQRNAHAWVEVYFPGEDAWITFDPTPASGENDVAATGFVGTMNKYLEALETYWIENFVAFDNQEQRSLASSVRTGFLNYQQAIAGYLGRTQDAAAEWLADIRGDKGWEARRDAAIYGIAYLIATLLGIVLLVWLYRKMLRLKVWQRLWDRLFKRRQASIVEFYERMQKRLAEKGIVREPHQTPMEFANAVGMPEAVSITEKYNRVRFGEKALSEREASEIENWLRGLEHKGVA
ncbi:MAG: DUF3488 domain-containing protein [Pyrinomonadaceae bacterium]|nr:DUF3488 domain-containing protein [Pyrinomonadaceae bacterium]